MSIAEKWDNMSKEDKLQILLENFTFNFILYREKFVKFCDKKFNEITDNTPIKNVIINELSK